MAHSRRIMANMLSLWLKRFGCLAQALALGLCAPALAQSVSFDFNGVTRSEALAKLFPEGAAEIEWKDPAQADEPVEGHFEGSQTLILKEILAPADFAAIYTEGQDGQQIVKVIVLERAAASAGPAQVTPVVEPPPNQLQQQQHLLRQQQQQQRALRQQQAQQPLQQAQQPGTDRARMPPGVRRQPPLVIRPPLKGQQPPASTDQQ